MSVKVDRHKFILNHFLHYFLELNERKDPAYNYFFESALRGICNVCQIRNQVLFSVCSCKKCCIL